MHRGHTVLTFDVKRDQIQCEKIVAVVRHHPSDRVDFLNIYYSEDSSVLMTANHILYNHSGVIMHPIPARDLRVGDRVMTIDGERIVERITAVSGHPIRIMSQILVLFGYILSHY